MTHRSVEESAHGVVLWCFIALLLRRSENQHFTGHSQTTWSTWRQMTTPPEQSGAYHIFFKIKEIISAWILFYSNVFFKEGRDEFWRQVVGADGGWTNLDHSGPACGRIQATDEKHFVNLKGRFPLNVDKANKYYLKLHVTCDYFHVWLRPQFYANRSRDNLLKSSLCWYN